MIADLNGWDIKMKNSTHFWFSLPFPKVCLVFLFASVLLLYTLVQRLHSNAVQPIPSYPISWSSVKHASSFFTIHPQQPCAKDTQILILVGSHPDHVEIREVLRHSWGGQIFNRNVQLVFAFGQLDSAKKQKALMDEHQKYGDILQGQFKDSYHNVTIRDLMALKWGLDNCPLIDYFIRADDDIAVDIHSLVQLLNLKEELATKDYVGCFNIVKQAKVQRWDRYAISHRDYSLDIYDDYCQGWLYVVTRPAVSKWLAVASRAKVFWINDVYITGVLSREANITLSHMPLRFTDYYSDMLDLSKSTAITQDDYLQVGPTKAEPLITKKIQTLYKAIHI